MYLPVLKKKKKKKIDNKTEGWRWRFQARKIQLTGDKLQRGLGTHRQGLPMTSTRLSSLKANVFIRSVQQWEAMRPTLRTSICLSLYGFQVLHSHRKPSRELQSTKSTNALTLKPFPDTLPTSIHPPFNLNQTLQQNTLFKISNYNRGALRTQNTTLCPWLAISTKPQGPLRPKRHLVN